MSPVQVWWSQWPPVQVSGGSNATLPGLLNPNATRPGQRRPKRHPSRSGKAQIPPVKSFTDSKRDHPGLNLIKTCLRSGENSGNAPAQRCSRWHSTRPAVDLVNTHHPTLNWMKTRLRSGGVAGNLRLSIILKPIRSVLVRSLAP